MEFRALGPVDPRARPCITKGRASSARWAGRVRREAGGTAGRSRCPDGGDDAEQRRLAQLAAEGAWLRVACRLYLLRQHPHPRQLTGSPAADTAEAPADRP